MTAATVSTLNVILLTDLVKNGQIGKLLAGKFWIQRKCLYLDTEIMGNPALLALEGNLP